MNEKPAGSLEYASLLLWSSGHPATFQITLLRMQVPGRQDTIARARRAMAHDGRTTTSQPTKPGTFDVAAFDAQVGMAVPGHAGMLSLCNAHLSSLPDDARILCVGVGAGLELECLAERHPGAPRSTQAQPLFCGESQPRWLLQYKNSLLHGHAQSDNSGSLLSKRELGSAVGCARPARKPCPLSHASTCKGHVQAPLGTHSIHVTPAQSSAQLSQRVFHERAIFQATPPLSPHVVSAVASPAQLGA